MIEPILIHGLITGGTYALLALGFTLIYGVSGVVNMAHGSLFMLAAYIYFAFTSQLPIGIFWASIIAILATGAMGSILYRLLISPIINDEVAVLVVTIGTALIFEQAIILRFRSHLNPVPSFISGYFQILGVKVTFASLLAFLMALALFLILGAFLSKSKAGRAMRALSQDREAALLMGVNIERLYMMTMAISAAIAAIAGILITASQTGAAYPSMWYHPLYMSFAIVILGGLGSVKGTLVGALIIAYTELAFIFLVSAAMALAGAAVMTAMILTLLLRPKGLFGRRIEME